jgi:hypothetical protein
VSDEERPAFNSKLEQVLLSRYGDLEAVWGPGGALLQQSLLKLPPYAMEVLLASNKLQVRPSRCPRVLGLWLGLGFMVGV